MARLTWVRAVAGLTTSRSAISWLDSPAPARAMTSRSRSVRAARSTRAGGLARRRAAANSAISRRVTLGASRASPSATTRTARSSSMGSVFLSRKPLAPAARAANTYSSSSKVVRTSTRTPARSSSATIRRVASRPSSTGMRMSISTTSGRVERASSTAAAPSPASPTTSMSPASSSRARNPARTSPWSSTSRTLITGAPPRGSPDPAGSSGAHREAGLDAEPAPGPGAGLQAAPEGTGPLPHARDPLSAPAGPVARRVVRAGPVVDDLDLDPAVVVGDGDVGPAGPGVAHDVGERLLDHPVGGQVDGRREPPRLALQRHPDLHPGPGRLDDQGVQLGQAGRRGQRRPAGVAVALAEHAQHGVQLPEGLVAGLADGGQRVGGLVGPAVQQVGRDPGLDADHPDGVGDHVVQLPGDAQPLLVDPAAGLLLPGPLGPLGPVPQLGHVRPAGPHRLPPPHGGQHRHGRVQRFAVEHGVAVEEQLGPGGLH